MLQELTHTQSIWRELRAQVRGSIMTQTKQVVQALVALIFLLALTAGGFACRQHGEIEPRATPMPSADGQITIYFAVPDQNRQAFTQLAADFHTQFSHIRVEIISLDEILAGDYQNDVDRRLMSRADAAYYWLSSDGVLNGAYRDLTPFAAADDRFTPDHFFPGLLEAFSYRGRQWALPSEARLTFMLYDKRMFDEAGIPYPDWEWTKEEFLQTAQLLTAREGNETTRYGFVDLEASQAFIDWSAKGRLDSQELAAAVSWYADLALQHGVMPLPPMEEEDFSFINSLAPDRRAAMWSGNWQQYEFDAANKGIALFPTDDGPRAVANMYGYAMSSGAQYPEETWLWLSYLTHQRVSQGQFQNETLPARRLVAETTDYWQQFTPETVEWVRYAAEHLAISSPIQPGGWQLRQAIQAIFTGQPVEAALQAAQLDLEEYLASAASSEPLAIEIPQRGDRLTINFAPPFGVDHRMIEEFHDLYPQIQVELIYSEQGDNIHCLADQRYIDPLNPPSNFLNLTPLADADPDFALDDFPLIFTKPLSSQGNLYGAPLQAQARVLFYNPDLFDRAGLSYPNADWTLDDFLDAALRLTAGQEPGKQYGFLPLNGDASDFRFFLALQGARVTDDDGNPRLDSPETVAALRWYADLALTHGVMPFYPDSLPHPNRESQELRWQLVREGKVAMWTDFAGIARDTAWPPGAAVWPPDTAVGMVPVPAGEVQGTDFAISGFFISADSGAAAAKACWQLIAFLSRQPELITAMPARRSLLNSDRLPRQAAANALETYQIVVQYKDFWADPDDFDYTNLLNQALRDVYEGADPLSALQNAQRKLSP
jgi:ABC-type glycerol-3-phosphate transport system substrate-binding protein